MAYETRFRFKEFSNSKHETADKKTHDPAHNEKQKAENQLTRKKII